MKRIMYVTVRRKILVEDIGHCHEQCGGLVRSLGESRPRYCSMFPTSTGVNRRLELKKARIIRCQICIDASEKPSVKLAPRDRLGESEEVSDAWIEPVSK